MTIAGANLSGLDFAEQVWSELWVSLASMLRSYTSAHGLNGNRQATVELGEHRILARHAGSWLELNREGPSVTWMRENGDGGTLELTEAGQLRGAADSAGGEDLDMAAEAWARELMR